jgi:hypothetical protein
MTPELKTQLAAMAQQIQALTAAADGGAPAGMVAAAPAGGAGWLTPPAPQGAMPSPVGWSVVMEIPMQGPKGQGTATVDLCYAPETWQQAPQIIAALIAQGYPVKVWVPKSAGFGGAGGGFRRGGFGAGGGWGG